MISNYKKYLDTLNKFVQEFLKCEAGSSKYKLGNTALICVCNLLKSVTHFNFRKDLLNVISKRLSRKRFIYSQSELGRDIQDDCGFDLCIATLEEVFQDDEQGIASYEAVQILTKMMKTRHYKVDDSVVRTFLHLRLLTELDILNAGINAPIDKPKLKKKDRMHRTKRERKQAKEVKALENEFKSAEQVVSREETERLQSETLKIVFATYFHILKERASNLLGITLEGLAKFAHLINADLFGDLLEALKELIRDRYTQTNMDGEIEIKPNSTRESLLCIVTAFALLSGQTGESIGLDLTFFVGHLYRIMMPLSLNPDVDLSKKALRLDNPLENNVSRPKIKKQVDLSTEMEIVMKVFDALFFSRHYRTVSFGSGTSNDVRMAAFAKRLAIVSLNFPDKSCYAALKLLEKLCMRYSARGSGESNEGGGAGAVAALFSTEDRIMNGVYRPEADQPDLSNALAANMWETFLLEKHYSPIVSELARKLPMKTTGA